MNAITSELKKVLQIAKEQVFSSGQYTDTLTLTAKCKEQAQALGLTEADIKDVYHHGTVSKTKSFLITKDDNGSCLTISYFLSSRTGHPVISSVRKWQKTY